MGILEDDGGDTRIVLECCFQHPCFRAGDTARHHQIGNVHFEAHCLSLCRDAAAGQYQGDLTPAMEEQLASFHGERWRLLAIKADEAMSVVLA